MTIRRVALSTGQEAMWIAWKLDPGQWSHIIPIPFLVRGTIDTDRLRQAVAEVGEALPHLRGRVATGPDGGPVLDWSDAPEIPVRRSRTALDRDTAIREAWQTPFDLRSGPLARVDLIEGGDYTVLLLAVHHLVHDGASVLLLLDALRTAYEGRELPRADHVPALAAFAARSRDLADGPAGDEHRAYWRDTLRDGACDFALPAGREEPRYTVVSELMPAELTAALRRRAAELGMSYATVLFGGYFALLGRYSGATDVLSFLPYHGRSLPGLDGRIGYFVNPLPVRAQVDPDDRLVELLGRVRSRVKEALAHGDLPLPAIMRSAGLTGPDARRRTHQTVFQYWHAGLRDDVDVQDLPLRAGGSEARLSLLDMESTAGFALALMVREDSGGTHLLWKDPAGSVGEETVRAMAADYLRVLRALAHDPRARIGDALPAGPVKAGPRTGDSAPGTGGEAATAAAPGSRVAEMAAVWRSVLNCGPIDSQDSFFELGGHSLLAEALVAAVRRRFGGTCSIRLLFDHPRLADFTAHALPRSPRNEEAGAPAAWAPTPPVAEARADTFPASSFQRRIWLAERVADDPASYNVPLAWRVEQPLDADAVRRALAATIARHEILRTSFHELDGELMQTVREPWTPAVEQVDLGDRDDPEQALRTWLRTASHAPFDIASGRLLTAALIELGPAGQVLFVCLHHLLWDGECEQLLLRELDAHYIDEPSEDPARSGAADRPAPDHTLRPASAHQERMWFVDRFENGHVYATAPTYHNLPFFVRLDRVPERAALGRAVDAVVRAHEALRTELVEADGRVVQRVRDAVTVVPRWLPAVPGRGERSEVPPSLTEWAGEPFDLGDGPLLRFAVQPLDGAPGGWLAMSGHQAVVDRASLELVAGQVLAALSGGTPHPSSFGAWLDSADSHAHKRDLTARADVLQPLPDPLRLPERRTRDAVHVYEERTVSFTLPAGLDTAAGRLGTGVPEVALAALAAVLQWYTGQEDMVLGLSHPGRREDDRHVVGPLANFLPVRLRPRADATFAQLVADTTAEVRHATEHDRAPFDELVRLVDPSKDMSRTALFDVLFSYAPAAPRLDGGPGGVTAEPVTVPGGHGKYDLHLFLQPCDAGHRAHLVHNGRYFDHDQISAMAQHYRSALRQLTERPELEVAGTDPLSEAERHTQLHQWNASDAGYEETPVHDRIRGRALARPLAVALTDGDQRITYAELMADAEAVARGLVDAGVEPGELVALLFPRGADQVRAMLGTLLAGAAYLPVDPAVPEERKSFILSDSGVRLALVPGSDPRTDADGFSGRALALDALLAAGPPAPGDRGLPSVPLDSPAYCIYTSGTTGRPKGVVLTHRNLARLLDNDRLPFAFGPQDVWTMFHSYAFDFSVWELFGGLVHGGRVVLVSEDETRDPQLFFDLLQRERVTVLNQTPSAFRRLLGLRPAAPGGLAALRYVIFGGEMLRPGMLGEWAERFPHVRLVNMYGITETTVHASVRTVTRGDIETDTSVVGTPIPTTRLLLLDRHTGRRLLPVGAVGELYVGGEGVAGGYLNRPELTAARFVPSPFGDGTLFRSGDLAAYNPDGTLRFIGRADSQIQLRGYRIEPGEVQACLCEHPEVSDAVVFAEDDRLVAVAQSGRELSARELRGHLARRLPSYMIPSLFHVVPSIPLTVNGKADVAALRAATAALHSSGGTAPRTATGIELAAVWRDVLGVATVHDSDSFFALGGHSMLAVRLVGEIAERFGVDLPIKTLFETPRLGDLADTIDAAAAAGRPTAEPATTAPRPAPPAPTPALADTAPENSLPASAFQRGLWLAEQTGRGTEGNIPLAWTVDGHVDVDVLRDALARLVAGHEILRTAFRAQGGTVRQIIGAPWRPTVEVFAPQHVGGTEDAATRWLMSAVRRPFDPASGRLLRAAVADLGPRGQAVMLCLHHLVVDGESVPVLVRELERCYRESLAGVPSAPPAVQYGRYSAALDREAAARRAADLDFWRDRLTGWPARLDLPAPAAAGPDGALRLALPDGVLGRLRPVMNAHGATWFMLVSAALAVALQRWSGQRSVTFGVPVTTRDTEYADLLGPCLNMVVLRSALAEDATTADALRAMRGEVLDAFEHSRTPFEEVLARLAPERDAHRSPYTDVAINMKLPGDRSAVLGDGRLRPLSSESLWSHDTKFGITLTVTEQDGDLDAVLSYQGARVTAEAAQALADTIRAALTELADPPPAQYRDFVLAQEAARGGERHEADLAHWQRHLEGATPYPDLPAPREPEPHGVIDLAVPGATGSRLHVLREQHGISPFMAVATALALVLHRRTGSDDVVISSPMTNRGRRGLAGVFGPCLNTVVLRSRLTPEATALDVLKAMRDETLQAFAHGETPFEDVIGRLNPPRRPGRTPYADVSLAFSTAATRPATLGGRTLRAVGIDGDGASFTGKLGLTVALTLDGDQLRGHIAYHGGHFRRTDAEEIADALSTLLARLPEHLDTPVADLDLVTPDQLQRIRQWERGPEPESVTTTPALVLRQAEARPDATAVETEHDSISYGDLVARARSLAEVVRPHLPATEPTVALLLHRGVDFVVGMLAAWFAEAAFCPLDPSWPAARQEFVLGDVQADVLLTRPGTPVPPAGDTVVVDVTDVPARGTDRPAPDWSPDSTAYVIYTSGTTGKPKGVVVRHGGLANLVRSAAATQGIGPGDRCTHLLSVSFDSSQMEVWQALANGACLVPHEEAVAPSTLGEWIDRRGATVAFLATALAEAVWSAGSAPRGLRWMGFGGAALSQRPPAGLPYRLLNSYGPTENTVASSDHEVDPAGSTPLNCIGRPIAGVRMLVLDPRGRRCPVGVPGEIHLAGAGVAAGYLRRPELTAERFRTLVVDGEPLRVYRSGDLGRRLADGTVEYLGRADRQLKIRGYRIEPGEIEHFLLRQPEVAHAAVTGDPQRTPALVGYVTPRDGRTPDGAELLRRARAELPAFMVPEALVVLPELPLTTSGKVDHAALPRPSRGDLVGAGDHVVPRTDIERRVAGLWSDILGLPTVGVHDNFFDLGGNSLALAKLHSRLVASFGRRLPITALFEHTTVSGLARLLSAPDGQRPPQDTGTPRRPARAGRQTRRGRRRPGTTEGA